MENEIMNYEEAMESEVNVDEPMNANSGIGTGVAMLIGAGLTIATTAAVKLGKKLWAKYKETKKESDSEVSDHDFVMPTDEQIKAVTKKEPTEK